MKKTDSSHTYLEQLAKLRIPIFDERGAENNRQILKLIAINGPMLKYDISKKTNIARYYSTVSRRVDDLADREYLREAGTRTTERGKQSEESMYGLTWKGFIASIIIEDVRENILQALKINPLLVFPEKELILTLIEEILTQQEIEMFAISFLEAFLETIPDLELIKDEQLPLTMMSALQKLNPPKNFRLSRIPKDAWRLLDRPAILEVIKEKIVPSLRQCADGIKAMYQLVSAFDGFDKFFYSLDTRDQPSKKIKEYVEARLRSLSEANPKIQKITRKE